MNNPRAAQLRATGRDVRDALIGLVPTAAALLVAAAVLAGLVIAPWWTALLVAAVLAAADALVRPALRVLAGRIGAVAALVSGVVVQVALVELALLVVPTVSVATLGTTVLTLVIVALVSAATRWLVGVNDSSYLVADLVRRGQAKRRAASGPTPDAPAPGVVVVQIDGLPYPLLQYGIVSGVLPTLARWVRSGGHDATRWWMPVPSTTPSGQAGLLHGNNEFIPAFRWYDKTAGRMFVTNRPADAAAVEARLSDGRGLLADGGVSVSNMFSGDAPTTLMTMSHVGRGQGLGPGRAYVRFFASPFVFVRALALTLGEMLKELYQGRQQRLRGIEPRIRRRGAYVALRGVTNVLLRDLNVALVAEHMIAGAPAVFVDFVDYDEIAHHAGVARPESLDALAGVDRVLGTLEKVAAAAPREYRFVVVSDHGQSQGPTFRQLTGRTLEAAVRAHLGAPATDTGTATGTATATATGTDDDDAEMWGPLNTMLTEVLSAAKPTARWAQWRAGDLQASVEPADDRPELAVVGSGNLGLVWFPRLPGRVAVEELNVRYPTLVSGLLAEAGIAFVVADSARGPLAIGPRGLHVLQDGLVEGVDPLGPFGPRAAGDLARAALMEFAPDLYVHSTLDARTGEVHAFEELVGCHGGLGGWQNDAVLVHPADWPVDPDLLDHTVEDDPVLYGADAVYRQLVRWMERCGARRPPDALRPQAHAGGTTDAVGPSGELERARDRA